MRKYFRIFRNDSLTRLDIHHIFGMRFHIGYMHKGKFYTDQIYFSPNTKYIFLYCPLLPEFEIGWITSKFHRFFKKRILYFSGSIAKPYYHMKIRFGRLFFGIKTPTLVIKLKEELRFRNYEKEARWAMENFSKEDFEMNYFSPCSECGRIQPKEIDGFAGEPVVICRKCGAVYYWADPLPYCE